MLKLFWSPTVRFRELTAKPEWSLPLVLGLLVPLLLGALSSSLLPRRVLIDSIESRMERVKRYIDEQVEKGRMPSDQRGPALERIEGTSRQEVEAYERSSWPALFLRFLVRSLPAVVWSLIQLLIFTALLNLIMPLLGGATSFGRMLAVTANAALVRIAGAVVHGLLMFATGRLAVNTSLSLVLPAGPVFVRGFLSAVDIFTVWELVLIGLGMKVVFNLPGRRSWFAVFGIWLVYIIILALLATISGGLALPE
ncbi:MAG: Yip1 family protein [candidate division WOR-3 bacterium]